MPRLSLLLLTLFVSVSVRGDDRFIPVFTGNISGRMMRTTVDLRSATREECRFELRAPNGAMFHSVVPVEAGKPMLLDEFAAEFRTFATTVKVSCTGTVDVHSRIHQSADGGVTYAEGSLFRAVVPEPLTVDQPRKISVTSDFIVAEIHGAPARVTGTLTATDSNWVRDKQWDLPAFGEHALLLTEVLLSVGPMEADLRVAGEGQVIFIPAVTDPAFVKFASRAPDPVRARLDAQVRAAANPQSSTNVTPITRQLLTSSFKAAPFQEPMTGLVMMRDRWYDPKTGTFMTPDRAGYRDSPNLYAYGKGDPVNNSDPTGMYIDETAILNSPLRSRYTAWRDDFRSSQLGREAWDRLHALPASTFTLRMQPLAATAPDDTGAIAERFYDASGNFTSASISFGPKFGSTAPDASQASNLLMYARAFDVERTVMISRKRYRVYSFGHEFGHVLSGFDPATAADAQQFSTLSPQLTAVGQQILPLLTKQRTVGLTPQEQATLAQLQLQQQQLKATLDPLKLRSEQYGDALGYEFFRSWNQQHHRIFERPNPNPPPALPPGALPPP